MPLSDYVKGEQAMLTCLTLAEGQDLNNQETLFKVLRRAILEKGVSLGYMTDLARENKELVMAALNNRVDELVFVGERLRDDKDVILAAVVRSYDGISYASERLKKDRDLVLAAVNCNGRALGYVPEFKDDEDVVLDAVSRCGFAICFASKRLQANGQVVYTAASAGNYYGRTDAVVMELERKKKKIIERADTLFAEAQKSREEY